MSELFLKIYLKYKNPGFAGGSDSAESKGEFLGKLFFFVSDLPSCSSLPDLLLQSSP